MSQNDIRLHIFLFILRVALFVITGVALHDANIPAVQSRCPMLWELTATILCVKCIRLTLYPILLRVLRLHRWWMHLANVGMYSAFFITETVLTSQSLNSPDCMVAASLASGHPTLIFASFALCIYDGAYVLSHALFGVVNRF